MLDSANYTPRLKAAYKDTIRGALKEEFAYSLIEKSFLHSLYHFYRVYS